ncbi:MAG: radical SAM protein [Candidatus Obscuribacter sp.]|nr:radical SAM protein [Candidatus Obscuribacter sp.]
MAQTFNTETRLAERIRKEDPDLFVTWYFPNTYEIGMSGLGYQLVWWLLEQDPALVVRRGFTDAEEPWQGLCDLLGFTVSWELDFINIISLLRKNDVPLTAKARLEESRERESRKDPPLPLVFGGGPVLTANPEPFHELFDVILLGDAETSVPSLVEAYRNIKKEVGGDREQMLYLLSQVPGLYVPSQYTVEYSGQDNAPIKSISPIRAGVPPVVQRQNFAPPSEYATHTQILSSATTWSERFLIEVVRSCPQECRFCLASYLTRPFRATPVDTLMTKIEEALKHTSRIGLLGPSVTEHPLFDELAKRLAHRSDIDISIASVRADSLNENILATLKALGQKTLTIAIESGSERLRTVMKKNLSEAEIFQAVELIYQAGFEGIKFYGIAGLPHERQEDLEQTVDLLQRLKKKYRSLRFVFGVSSFVPKAQTPFQWHGRDRQSGKKLEYLRKNLARLGIEVRPESHNWSDIQALISRGDRRLAPVLESVSGLGENLGAWKKAMRNLPTGVPDLDYYAFREIPLEEVLPWQHLSDETKSAYLKKHKSEAALAGA